MEERPGRISQTAQLKWVVPGAALLFAGACFSLAISCALEAPRRRVENPSVLLITIDTLRAGHLGAYGNRQVETPNLDRIAADGVVFEHAASAVPLTLPSHATIFTGLYPWKHGIRDNGFFALDRTVPTLTEHLKSRRYSTAAFIGSYVLAARFGLDRGFDTYDDDFGVSGSSTRAGESVERPAPAVIGSALRWLQTRGDKPFFCWIHLNDPHTPYAPPEPWRSRYADRLYDGEIAYTDSALSPLLSFLEQKSRYDHLTIVVAGDHGESLGDHGESTHGLFLYESTMHVPLIVKLPNNRLSHTRVAGVVSLVDVAPTLLAIAGDETGLPGCQGVDLFGKADPERRVYAETSYPESNFGWSRLQSVQAGGWKFIDAPEPELYDVAHDAAERQNLSTRRQETVGRMRKLLQAADMHSTLAQNSASVKSSQASIAKLRSLGYLGEPPSTQKTAPTVQRADPKAKIAIYEQIAGAQRKIAEGRCDSASTLLKLALTADPNITLAHHQLGTCYSQLGNHKLARKEFQRAAELNPQMTDAWFDLGLAQIRLHEFREAEASFNHVLHENPDDHEAQCYLGVALAGMGKTSQALEALQRATAAEPNFGEGWFQLGGLELRSRDYTAAIEHFERASQAGYSSGQFHAEFGWLLMERNDAAKASAQYALALKTNPNDPVLHNNLGFALASSGDVSAAIDEYRRALVLSPNYARAQANLKAAIERESGFKAAIDKDKGK